MKPVDVQVYDEVLRQIRYEDQVGYQVHYQVFDQVYYQVDDQVHNQFYYKVLRQVREELL